jgi:hypothetical protein
MFGRSMTGYKPWSYRWFLEPLSLQCWPFPGPGSPLQGGNQEHRGDERGRTHAWACIWRDFPTSHSGQYVRTRREPRRRVGQ